YVVDALYTHSKVYAGLTTSLSNIYTNNIPASEPTINTLWLSGYQAIGRINSLLENSGNYTDQEVKTIRSMAIFIRANIYQSMTELWGDVIYQDKTPTASSVNTLARASIATIREKSITAINAVLTGLNYRTTNTESSIRDAK